jgi:hypothetical protein
MTDINLQARMSGDCRFLEIAERKGKERQGNSLQRVSQRNKGTD